MLVRQLSAETSEPFAIGAGASTIGWVSHVPGLQFQHCQNMHALGSTLEQFKSARGGQIFC